MSKEPEAVELNLDPNQQLAIQAMIAEVETTKATFFESANKQIAFFDGVIAGYRKLLSKEVDAS